MPDINKPNIILLGVGHSGTTIVTRMLFELGWNRNDADQGYAECNECRKINADCHQLDYFDYERARIAIGNLQSPWLIKDPRYILTLDKWHESFLNYKLDLPLVIWLTRNIVRVEQSYLKRGLILNKNKKGKKVKLTIKGQTIVGVPGFLGKSVRQLHDLAKKQFVRWDGPKVRLEYEHIKEAVKLFDIGIL
jgi:hypothetical protein